MWDIQREIYIETTETTCIYQTDDKINSPPYMQLTIEDVHVNLGEPARFEAVIEGNPTPTIAWYKDNTSLGESDRVSHVTENTKYSLILNDAKPDDGGIYTCIARNTGGEVSCKAELIVHEEKKDLAAKTKKQRRKLHSFYEVKEEIGRGSFGFVKRVVHKENQANCAAKFIPLRSRTRLQAYRERDILGAISHERITLLLDTFETKKTLVLILELCSSEELLDRLFQKGEVTEAEVKFYIKQILEGVAYLHEKDILHLDIKPPNILMVHPDKEDIKICDFGFAQKIDCSQEQFSKFGSPEFVSPEIISEAPVSKASDIWAVGVISYLSLTCSSPFAGENDRSTLMNVQQGKVSWSSADFVRLSEGAKDYIKRILQIAPDARPSALECLSHVWFLEASRPDEAKPINTKRLKFLVARSRWQRALMSYKSVLVMRSIPDLLNGKPDTPSLGVPRQMVDESSSSSTSGSSSDNEYGGVSKIGEESSFTEPLSPLMFDLHGHLEHTFEEEYPASYLQEMRQMEKTRDSELSHGDSKHKEESEIDPDRTERKNQDIRSELAAEDSEDVGLAKPILFKAATIEVGGLSSKREKAECLLRGSSADSALLPGVTKADSSMCVPRQSVIKSTFYSQAFESPRLSTSEGLPIDKEYVKHLERARRHYLKSGYSKRALGGLREPLLEHFGIDEEDRILIQESNEKKRPSSGLPKSVSFDIGKKSPKTVLSSSARSRSLDYSKPRDTSPYARQLFEKTDSKNTKHRTGLISSQKFDTQLEEPLPRHKSQQYDVERTIRNVSHRVTSPIIDASAERPASVPECDEESTSQNYVPVSVYLKEQIAAATPAKAESTVIEQYERTVMGASNDVHVKPGHSIQCDDAGVETAKPQEVSVVLDFNKHPPTSDIKSGEEVFLQRYQSPTSEKPENVTLESAASAQGADETIVTVRYLDSPHEISGSAIRITDESTELIDMHQRTPEAEDSSKGKLPSSAERDKDSDPVVHPQDETLLTASPSRIRCDEKIIRTVQYQVTVPTSEDATGQPDPVPEYNEEPGHILRRQETTTVKEPSEILPDSTAPYGDKTVLTVQFEDATLVSDYTTGRSSSATPFDGENTILIVQHHRAMAVPEHSSQKTRPVSQDDNESTILIVKHQTSTPMLDTEKDKPPSVTQPDQESTVLVTQHQRVTPLSDSLEERTSSTMKRDEDGTTVVFKHQIASSEADFYEPIPPRRRPRSKEHQRASPSAGVQSPTKCAVDQKLQRLSAYSKEESAALECIVDEMVYLSEEMNVLANSMSAEDSSEKYSVVEEKKSPQDPPTLSAVSSSSTVTESKRDSDDIDVVLLKVEESTSSLVKESPCVQSIQHTVRASSDHAQTPPPFHEHVEDITLESGSSSKTYFSHSGSSGTGRRSDNFSDFEEAGRESEVSLVEILDLLEENPRTSSQAKRESTASAEPIYVHLSDLYDMKHIAESKDISDAQEASGDRSSISIDELLQMSFEKETPYNITEVFTMYPNIAQDSVVQTTQTFYENVHGSLMDRASKSGTSEGGGSRSSKECSSVELEHPYNYPTNESKEHTSSVSLKQHKPGLFRSHSKSESIEKHSEQSLKQKVKASVANISRIIKGKQMSERYKKEESGEPRKELSRGESFEGAAGPVKRRSGLPSFKLSGIKSKEKVTLAPAFVEELTDQTVVLGHSITLSCRTSAHSDPTVEWFKDGIPIQGNDRVMISSTRKNFQLLTILAVTAHDLGIYACVATNHLGGASTCCIIKKAEIPCCPTSPDIAQMHEDAVLVIWKPVESSHPVTYTLQCRKEGGEWKTLASNISDCCYFASNLTPGAVYSFRITCNSKAGVGPYSSPSAEVRIGDKSTAILQSATEETPDTPDEDNRQLTPALMASTHPTYAFQSEIQRGRFSTVRRCREKSSGRLLAAKTIPYTTENKQSKLAEYHILKKLHHTNIVQLHAAYVSPRHLVLILELCEGLELLQCLAQGTSYSELEVRDYLWQMLSAVEFLHTNHVLHLDIRSENTIVTEHKQLKLLDFGSAQVYTQDQVLATGVCQDFIENLAPELLEGHGAIPQTDVWAVGVTAFIMLSGDYPFCLNLAGELEKAIKQGKVKFTKCYAGLSGGAVSFLQSTLWANAWGRPSASVCLQSPWLQEAGMATMQQVAHAFPTAKLRGFLKERSRKGPSC